MSGGGGSSSSNCDGNNNNLGGGEGGGGCNWNGTIGDHNDGDQMVGHYCGAPAAAPVAAVIRRPNIRPKTYQDARKRLEEIISTSATTTNTATANNSDDGGGGDDHDDQDDVDEAPQHAHMEIKVDYYPYLPYLVADPNDDESIKRVVLMVLLASHNHYDDEDEDNDDDDDDSVTETENDSEQQQVGGKDITSNILNIHRSGCGGGEDEELRALLKVEPIVGGNTNRLFRVSGLQAIADHKLLHATVPLTTLSTNDSVIVRVFGGHGLVDRDVETSVYASLARQNLAFRYYGRFSNGRLEEWCPWPIFRAMTEDDIADPTLSKGIAVELAHLHYRFDETKCSSPLQTDKLLLWKQLEDWSDSALDLFHQNKFLTDRDAEMVRTLNPSLQAIKDEIEWIRTLIKKHDEDNIGVRGANDDAVRANKEEQKVGFCHNDVLASNILWNCEVDTDKMKVRLIDFEYGGWNYFVYDIANHFNEFAGGTAPEDGAVADYTRLPSPHFQRSFCREYLAEKHWVLHQSHKAVDESDVDRLYEDVQDFIMANHLVWSLWAINSAATEGCDAFDYLKYAQSRLARYVFLKDNFHDHHHSQ